MLWRHYYAGTNALIFVVDSTDAGRLGEAHEELSRLLSERDLMNSTVLILANKQDATHALPAEVVSKHLNLPDSTSPDGSVEVNNHLCKVMPIVGATGEGVSEAMAWLVANTNTKRKGNKNSTISKQATVKASNTGGRK